METILLPIGKNNQDAETYKLKISISKISWQRECFLKICVCVIQIQGYENKNANSKKNLALLCTTKHCIDIVH